LQVAKPAPIGLRERLNILPFNMKPGRSRASQARKEP